MTKPICNLLLVEDEAEQRGLISQMLEQAGYQVTACDSVEAAIVELKRGRFDLVFSDWKLGQLTGMELLDYVRRQHPHLGFVVATAYGSIEHAVEAIQSGADDYLAKPFGRQELLLALDKAAKAAALRLQNNHLSQALSKQTAMVGIVGDAPCMQQMFERIRRVSPTKATVLIHGESGTGKELAARALHQLSERAEAPFVAINCGAIPESLAEAELFGAEKGAYTGATQTKIGSVEAADGGTLFLDEVAELSPLMQTKLLRFLQEGVITRLGSHAERQLDVRVIAASHKQLSDLVAKGEFREDLFYRLNVVPLSIPALRQRQSDIPQLVQHFVERAAHQYQCQPPQLSEETQRLLLDYHWPGNVRELGNLIERMVLLGDEQELQLSLKPVVDGQSSSSEVELPEQGLDWQAFERQALSHALQANHGNRRKAAAWLKLSYKAFLYRLEKYQITAD
ncbi:sigma-54-dependent transcriptional regulator [Paraferrimonas sedimenticola]|uniref:Acetoacetate metabolism regulatory protein AtoC n=1 Tax=Paraferrimonas sedimenticola TaxID=375674 RepID=A0AA37W118_9GAMM|nr:sigma-54 dependent transcriptional regulator [Paraferrimonas sedimenticola]GLP95712.1 acetoacetate metabolism regulatory protein AtoC [Paraferrimonas sedimenticola]